MKKSFFLLGVAVAAMTSCSNDKLLDQAEPIQRAIGFDSFVNKGTKATSVTDEVTAANLERFYVYGYHSSNVTVFDNVSVIKNGGNWTMEETNEKDWETKSYYFAAYADGPGVAKHDASSLATSTSFSNAILKFTGYSTENQTDLIAAWYARDNSTVLNTTIVDLDFKHLLSKVDFTFENKNTNDLLMVVSNVKLTVERVADCNFDANATWSNWRSSYVYTLEQPKANSAYTGEFEEDKSLADIDKDYIIAKEGKSVVSTEYFVIPGQEDATITYDVTFYDLEGNLVETKTNQVLSLFPTIVKEDQKSETISWTPSYIYKYNVQLPASPKKIEFNVINVGGWEQSDVPLDGGTATTNNPTQGA